METKAVKDAIQREKELGKFMLHRYEDKLSRFEDKYDMTTEEFVEKFEKGELGDDQDFFEWFAAFKGKQHWKEKLDQLHVV